MSKPNIVILDGHTANPGDLDWKPLEALGELTVHPRTPPEAEAVAERVGEARVALTNKTPMTAETLQRCPRLEYVGVLATGYNVIDLDAARARGITVTHVPGYATDSVAQHVFALLLELTNRVSEHDHAVHEGTWSACEDFSFTTGPIVELAGRTLGIVGLGDIGRRVAMIGAALGMAVSAAYQSSMNTIEIPGVPLTWRDHDTLFAEADVITLHCPLNPKTRHLVNAPRLGRMKPESFLVNTGRGELIDEAALARHLAEGRIAGAALDVLASEPPPADHPLLAAPRCLITPHLAWASAEARGRLIRLAAENLAAFLEGAPRNVVS